MAGDKCHVLNLQNGQADRGLSVDEEWGYLGLSGDYLVGTEVPKGSTRREESQEATFTITHKDYVPVQSEFEFNCYSSSKGDKKWIYQSAGGIMHPTITLLDGAVYFIEGTQLPSRAELYQVKEYVKSSFLVGIDLSTGKETFRQPVQSKSRHNIFMAGSKGRLVLVGTFNINERSPGIHRASNGILVYELKCFDINSKNGFGKKNTCPNSRAVKAMVREIVAQ
ncbi:hypothetical protein [Lentisphaera araneosa]|uniref:hypothetical protein n=1 Tax=Lentisphaera araneosa TaxID=256847 RepID=UPI000592FA16|nr:hypothetical protein [Lentisphaera araneosa]